ncbi:MAG TPA: hypothetical protein VMO17_15165 [Terriglobia bacterium]|nr:hypothetical protein [Terriglobia bacterium]
MRTMLISIWGRRLSLFLLQLVVVLGLIALYRWYVPYHAREKAAQAAAVREAKITAFFQDAVLEEPKREISVPLEGAIVKRHPWRLRTVFSPREATSALGPPDATTFDFRGGQHLTWIGTNHQLEASFEAGRVYCLSLEDRATGHGMIVYESVTSWHPY